MNMIDFTRMVDSKKNTANVIGEGSYGCVHKPSLECNTDTVDYENKISKILYDDAATTEMKEYDIISKADKQNRFYLGKPIKCKVKNNNYNTKSIRKCKDKNKLLDNLNNESLIVMEDGGVDLENFSKEIRKWNKTVENIKIMELFWIEVHRILLGLKNFLNNGIIHHDLKPQNLVFNVEKNRLNFIDFGLTTKIDKIIKESEKSINWLSDYHWSFPFEINFYNKDKFMKFAEYSKEQKDKYFQNVITKINKDGDTAFNIAFAYMVSNKTQLTTVEHYLNDFYSTLTEDIVNTNYEKFMRKSLNTLDLYGCGLAFMQILNKSYHIIDNKLSNDLIELIYYMVTPNLSKRYEIDMIINKFENILDTNGILAKYNVYFENHVLRHGTKILPKTMAKIKSLKKSKIIPSKAKIQTILNDQKLKECPPGKEINPKTGRCINITKKKECPPGKEINPTTRRCIKIPKNKTSKRSPLRTVTVTP